MTDYTVVKSTTGPMVEVYANIMTATAGWSCSMSLFGPDGVAIIDSQPVLTTNESDTRFVAFLTESQIDALPVETYVWEITLVNGSLSPAFEAVQRHNVMVEPIALGATTGNIVRGTNSFGTYEELLVQLAEMPTMTQAKAVSRLDLKTASVQAWYNIGNLTVDFEVEAFPDVYSTADFDTAYLDALTDLQRRQLLQAQLIEADFILGGNPIEQRRRMGLMSDSSGESGHFMRPTKPVVLPVCREAAFALTPYIKYSAGAGR